MKSTFLTALMVSGVAAQALAAETIQVKGVSVQADQVEYFVDSKQIHSFRVTGPTSFALADGNSFVATSQVYLDSNGGISAIVSESKAPVLWKKGDRVLKLDCAPRIDGNYLQAMNRMIVFHENQSYKNGCAAAEPIAIQDAQGGHATVSGDLEYGPDLQLTFAEKVKDGVLRIGQHDVKLVDGTSLGYFDSGTVNFFTPQAGQIFSFDVRGYGKLLFTQKEGTPTATFLTEKGAIELGILASGRPHAQLGFLMPSGSGVSFTELGDGAMAITGVVFSEPMPFHAEGDYTIQASKVAWDIESGFLKIVTSQPFNFVDPEDKTRTIAVPIGALVFVKASGKIVAIQMPK